MQYSVKLTKDDNGTMLVSFPDFEDAITFGDDEKDALFHAQNALDEVIAARIACREFIPEPTHRKGHKLVALTPLTEAKLLLYWSMEEKGLRKADLARLLSCNQKQVDRILDVRHNSSLGQLQRAFAVLGKRMTVQVRDSVA